MSVNTIVNIATGFLVALIACVTRPPTFSIEPDDSPRPALSNSRRIQAGHRATPPPGEYRFATMDADGYVESKEIFAFAFLKACRTESHASREIAMLIPEACTKRALRITLIGKSCGRMRLAAEPARR